MKKIINEPENFVDEVVEGILLAHGDELRAASADHRALVSAGAGTSGKVGIVTGGGSGHLPFFLGYVGQGLCTGVAVGNVFSSPSPEQIRAATIASDGGAGVLYLYGNYGGDVYNFDIAADLVAGEGVRTTTVVGTDDILSAPAEKISTRRGVAGLIFAYKTAGAAAERGDDLDAVARIAQRTVDRTRTMGVGLSPTILPAAGEPTFTLEDGEMEIGIGLHGEPGRHRGPLETADEITDRFLEGILAELDLAEGSRVALLVNGLGGTPLEELYLIYRRAHSLLAERGVSVHRRYVGEYATSLEMAGASLSVLRLDDELAELVDAPARSPFFTQGAYEITRGSTGHRAPVADRVRAAEEVRTVEAPGPLRAGILAVTSAMPAHSEELRELDAALGDGDLGITVGSGARAAHEAVSALPENAHPAALFAAVGSAFASANPSTFAALFGGGLVAASQTLRDVEHPGTADLGAAVRAAADRIMERGGAQPGDKTVVDALLPLADVLENATGDDPASAASRAAEAVGSAVDDYADAVSQRGRAGWLGERSSGHRDPGSVALLRLVEEVVAAIPAIG